MCWNSFGKIDIEVSIETIPMKIKRIYEQASDSDGYRILVDRLWPRGISKQKAQLDEWDKEIAPSTELRKWFGHMPKRFEEFARRYKQELTSKTQELDRLRTLATKQNLTLLYSAHDPNFNQAVVLLDVLKQKNH